MERFLSLWPMTIHSTLNASCLTWVFVRYWILGSNENDASVCSGNHEYKCQLSQHHQTSSCVLAAFHPLSRKLHLDVPEYHNRTPWTRRNTILHLVKCTACKDKNRMTIFPNNWKHSLSFFASPLVTSNFSISAKTWSKSLLLVIPLFRFIDPSIGFS